MSTNKCSNCGAPLSSSVCKYCGSVYTKLEPVAPVNLTVRVDSPPAQSQDLLLFPILRDSIHALTIQIANQGPKSPILAPILILSTCSMGLFTSRQGSTMFYILAFVAILSFLTVLSRSLSNHAIQASINTLNSDRYTLIDRYNSIARDLGLPYME